MARQTTGHKISHQVLRLIQGLIPSMKPRKGERKELNRLSGVPAFQQRFTIFRDQKKIRIL